MVVSLVLSGSERIGLFPACFRVLVLSMLIKDIGGLSMGCVVSV